ncbi:hydrolase [Kangiella japonica]|uniref:Hydrolase n=1 Tax=Kangiella japonica TaxID=647384 RepID=A0ABN0SYQ4_9GAMM
MNLLKIILIYSIAIMIPVYGKDVSIPTGSGSFEIQGGKEHPEKTIKVYYHKPTSFSVETKVVFVVPGGGRNGWSYRDAWQKASEKYDVLVLSPSYSEKSYPNFWSYNLAGMIKNVVINKERTAIVSLDVVEEADKWIYPDFDRIFDKVVKDLSMSAKTYDMFGHSAGGQILHRLTLFYPENKANRILASNSGWYTVPDYTEQFPYGLKGAPIGTEKIGLSFKNNLTVFLGELDNHEETRGHLVRNSVIDKQGIGRLSRGKYFFGKSKLLAKNKKQIFNWSMHIVPNVGHNYRAMSQAAAEFLYE